MAEVDLENGGGRTATPARGQAAVAELVESIRLLVWYSVTERTDFEIGMLVTEFIADRDSQEHTGQTTGCRHGDAEGLILENTVTTHGGAQARSTAGN